MAVSKFTSLQILYIKHKTLVQHFNMHRGKIVIVLTILLSTDYSRLRICFCNHLIEHNRFVSTLCLLNVKDVLLSLPLCYKASYTHNLSLTRKRSQTSNAPESEFYITMWLNYSKRNSNNSKPNQRKVICFLTKIPFNVLYWFMRFQLGP